MVLEDIFDPAGKEVVSEEIDGEVVIVNLNNGNYYSLTQSAAVIWAGITRGVTVEQMQSSLSARYSTDAGVLNQALAALLNALEVEKLISRRVPSLTSQSADTALVDQSLALEKVAFQPPVFERFTDMEDLLLLDPVHEAEDEKGWPHAKNDV